MRIKKAFTLAEILIVLMVTGVVATMTIPLMVKGANEATYKTAYKKAFNAVANFAAVEKIAGQLPLKSDATAAKNFFSSLNSNLSVREYWPQGNGGDITVAQPVETGVIAYTKATWGGSVYDLKGSGSEVSGGEVEKNKFSPWIVTEDGLAYAVTYTEGANCGKDGTQGTKEYISSQTSIEALMSQVCIVVAVDVNGVIKGPNILEPQVKDGVSSGVKMNQLYGDRYYIFIGTDGASPGHKAITVSGRLMADMK